ncbi:MAG: RibD family protein, partial [Pseudomonadota bacterium]|nr:RibD family protein [Pseudomonadota bacterium]
EKDGKLNLHSLMSALGDKQYNEVWVEAGPGLAGALLQEGLVDELICYQAPKLLGDKGKSMINLPAFTSLNECISLSLIENRQVGNDIKLIFRPDVSNTRG